MSIVLGKKIYVTCLLAVDTISCFLHVKSFATSCVLDFVKHFRQDAREVHVRHVQNEQRSVQKVLHVTQRPNLRSKILHRQCLPKMVYFSSTQSVENIPLPNIQRILVLFSYWWNMVIMFIYMYDLLCKIHCSNEIHSYFMFCLDQQLNFFVWKSST